jgi:tetratricopeptide (TPR) repeat protein
MNDYQNAIVNYTSALKTANNQYKPTKNEIFFERSNANYELGLINFNNKKYDNAIQKYKDAIEDNFENASAHYELGRTYCQLKMWNEGVHQFDLILDHGFRNIDLKMVKNNRDYAASMIE